MWLPMVLFFFFPMAAKLIGPNLEIHFLDEVIVFDHLPCKGLNGFSLDDQLLVSLTVTCRAVNGCWSVRKST